ncbi:MAG: ribosome-binding factor A [Myxococcota bacterium]
MKPKDLRAQMRALCAELGPDDGLTSDELAKQSRTPTPSRRHRRLAGQIARALREALGTTHDDVLYDVWVVDCTPDPDATRFLVHVRYDGDEDVLGHLAAARGWLRSEVANAIHRKRVPDLRFALAPEEAP